MIRIYLFAGRQEALEAAISERDAQLGLLEVSGIKTARAAERADDLRADRKRLMQMMKQQVIINDYGFCLNNDNTTRDDLMIVE